jgi:ribose transport system substrate-binding protein
MQKSVRAASTAALAAVIGLTGACSSSSKSASSPTTLAGSTTGSAGTTGSSGPSLASIQATVANLEKPITINYNPGPLPGNPAGKKIDVVTNSTSTGIHNSDLWVADAKLLGIQAHEVIVGNSAESIANSFNQIVADPSVNGVVVGGIDPSAYITEYNELVAKHIPIMLYAADNNPAWDNTSINILAGGVAVKAVAQYMADWVVADGGLHADAAIFNVPSQPILQGVTTDFTDQYKQICPTCTLDTESVAITALGTTLPGQVASFLQAHPSVKYVVMDFGDMMSGVPAALQAAGISGVKFEAQTASSTDMQYIRQGSETANFSYPLTLEAAVGVDALAREMLGAPATAAKNWVMPVQLMNASNVNGSTFASDGSATVPGLSTYFDNLWKVNP